MNSALWSLFAIVGLLGSRLTPGIESASTTAGTEIRVVVEPPLTLDLHRGCEPTYDEIASDSLLAARGGGTVAKTRSTLGGDGASSSITLETDAAGRTVSRTHTVTKDGQVIHQHQEHIRQVWRRAPLCRCVDGYSDH